MRTARRRLRRLGDQATGRARASVQRLEQLIERTRRVAAQTRQRLGGTTPDGVTRTFHCDG
ncbi:MAG TPA: hypothetical protein VKD67_02645 [Acidimicrobiales bacterium]|nr:hypothetical protein [Acidimicrobiales bacterium]